MLFIIWGRKGHCSLKANFVVECFAILALTCNKFWQKKKKDDISLSVIKVYILLIVIKQNFPQRKGREAEIAFVDYSTV